MRSTNLAFEYDYLYNREFDELFHRITDDYMFVCDNYAVAYQLLSILDKIQFCEHSGITDDCFYIYSWLIFITCRPEDIQRIKCIANRIPSSFNANIRIYNENLEVEI